MTNVVKLISEAFAVDPDTGNDISKTYLGEVFTLSDLVAVPPALLVRVAQEAIAMTDQLLIARGLVARQISEAIVIGDSATKVRRLMHSFVESLAVADLNTRSFGLSRTFLEALAVSDTTTVLAMRRRVIALSEIFSTSDIETVGGSRAKALLDALGMLDSSGQAVLAQPVISDSITLYDTVQGQRIPYSHVIRVLACRVELGADA